LDKVVTKEESLSAGYRAGALHALATVLILMSPAHVPVLINKSKQALRHEEN
jgi:hypothetical protein